MLLPPCGHANPLEARFCLECGAALALRCPRCGADLPANAKFCLACGSPMGQGNASPAAVSSEEADRSGERRQLTVLFCDLVGSTELSGRLDPEEWQDLVRAYQDATATVIEKHDGHVAQYLGDGVLVYFGYPTAHEDDAERAVRAGLGIVDALGAVNAGVGAERQLAVRVGIHTGPVVVSQLGAKGRREMLALGETTNIAARLQGLAAPDTVVMSAATQRLVPGMFVVEELGAQSLKGVTAPILCQRVVQPSGVRSRLDVAAGRLTRFVGRDAELATLVDRWERAADGAGQNVLIVGEAGVGKSRLAYQLRERFATIPHTWLECGATPYTEGTPFHPVIELVSQGLAFIATDTPAGKLEKIERGLRDLATPESVGLLADFLGLPLAMPLELNPDVLRRKTMELLARWNLVMSAVQPLVLVVEDLHWCDASSLELLGRIIAQSATARVLFIATARPEFVPPWPARSNVTTLQLARLTKRQAREMATTLVGETMSPETLEALVTRADGVPLYVEELTKAVAEPGADRGADAIPSTLAGSLMARLDRLSTAKEVAQRAAVIGRELSYELLAAISGMDEAGLRHGLARLVDAEILFARGDPPHATYVFKHALVQEAAYGSLLRRTRQQIHGRILDALRERAPAPEVVARHAEAAGRIDEAVAQYRLAGERAQARSADLEAIGQFQRALALLETLTPDAERDARELALRLGLGASLMWAHGYADTATAAAYERAVALATKIGDSAHLDTAQHGLAFVTLNRAELERAHALFVELLTRADRRGDRQRAGRCHNNLAIIAHHRGEFASSLASCERAAALCDLVRFQDVIGGNEGVARLCFVAIDLWFLGRPDGALAHAESAVSLARQLAHPFSVAYALFFEATIRWCRERAGTTAMRACVAELTALGDTHGFRLWLGFGRAADAGMRVTAGDRAALAGVLEGVAIAAETGQQLGAPGMLMFVAELQRAANALLDARGTVAAALAVAAGTGQPFWDADLHRLDGDLLVAAHGSVGDAVARYERALAIARTQGARSLELRAATSLARLWRDQGNRTEARDLLAPVYATFTEGLATRDLVDAKAVLDELA